MRYLLLAIMCLLLLLALPRTHPTTAQEADEVVTTIAADYPLVDGSTSTRPLQKVIASTLYDVPWLWTTYGYEPNYFVMAGLVPQNFNHPELKEGVRSINRIYHNGTHGSYMNLINGEVDFILVAREPSNYELVIAEGENIGLDVRPVALDAFVFLVNTNNPTNALTLDEIRGIYTGEITSWKELGVAEPIEDIPNNFSDSYGTADIQGNFIHPYTRNPNSGSQELMEALVMQDTPMISRQDLMQSNMGAPILAVNFDTRGIGYSVFFYASFMHPAPGIKLLGIEGVLPTSATIADQSYPLVTEVYAVVRGDMADDSPAVLLRDWLLSPQGQTAIAASGYVPLRN
jgi:phosphate transport system substrate-binding protein